MESTRKTWLTQNWNTFASSLLVHGLSQLGVRGFFVSPGYRDAPLIAALQMRPDLLIKSCMDERAAAYEALGFAKATRRPAVLVCTSGTAGANYLCDPDGDVMNASELRQKTPDELKQELLALRREQFNLRMQKATNQASKPHLFKQARRNIARVKMVLSEKAKA